MIGRLSYHPRLDRCVDLRGARGRLGRGFHNFMISEIELGCRVAHSLDDPEQTFWVLDLYSHDRFAG